MEKIIKKQYYESVTCAEMKEIERKADEGGLRYAKMMENAGAAAAEVILEKIRERKHGNPSAKGLASEMNVVLFCGKGNNGGDGYVVARILTSMGMHTTVVMAEGSPKTEDAISNANIVLRRGIPVIDAKTHFNIVSEIVASVDLVVDAVYGTGFHGVLPETVRACTRLINNLCEKGVSPIGKLVFALDISTGLNGDFGQPDKDTVIADYTIAFHRTKPVHELEETKLFCGEVVVVGIGIT